MVLTVTHECDDLSVVKSNGSGNVMCYKMYAWRLIAGTSNGLSSGNLSDLLNTTDFFRQTPQSPRIQKPAWTGTDEERT